MGELITWFFEFLIQWYWVPIALALIGVFFTVILENRNPAKAKAYLLLLVVLPGIGLIVFYFFGRDFRKQLKFKKKESWERFKSKEFWDEIYKTQENFFTKIEEKYGSLSKIPLMLFNQRNSLTLRGNKIKLLKNGENKFPEVFKALETAKHHIHLEYYIIGDDEVSNQLLDILVKKANQGVTVKVLVDGLGSRNLNNFNKVCKQNNIAFFEFMPVRFSNLASSNYRDHRKIIVIDGKIGFIGGINFKDKYWNKRKGQIYWRDTHLRIEGASVNLLQFMFLTNWKFVSKEIIPFEEPYFFNHEIFENETFVSVVSSGPLSPRPYGMDAMVALIYQAKNVVRMANPYFIPSDELIGAMINTAHSGVKVQLIIPSFSDSHIAQRATYSYLKTLVENGVEVYRYKKGFIHSKTLSIDDRACFIGSLNADMRSFYINFEASALVFDAEITSQLNKDFDEDLEGSHLLSLEEVEARPPFDKFMDSICRLLTPLL